MDRWQCIQGWSSAFATDCGLKYVPLRGPHPPLMEQLMPADAETLSEGSQRDQSTYLSAAFCLLLFCLCQLMDTTDLRSVTEALHQWVGEFGGDRTDAARALLLWTEQCCRAESYSDLNRWIGVTHVEVYQNQPDHVCHAFDLNLHGRCNRKAQPLGLFCEIHRNQRIRDTPGQPFEGPRGPSTVRSSQRSGSGKRKRK